MQLGPRKSQPAAPPLWTILARVAGKVHRIFHEDLVRDPETEIRRLLAYCGLPFEESCLRFRETG